MKHLLTLILSLLTVTGLRAANPSGAGTTNYIPLWNSTKNLTSSTLYQLSSTRVGLASEDSFFYHSNKTTGVGQDALFSYTGAQDITAIGFQALQSLATGPGINPFLVAVGDDALGVLTNGVRDTAVGSQSQFLNVSGNHNTSVGFQTLSSLVASNNNSAFGSTALAAAKGAENTGVGFAAGLLSITGDANTLVGSRADVIEDSSASNTVVGASSSARFNSVILGDSIAPGSGSRFVTIAGSGATCGNFTNSGAYGWLAKIVTDNEIVLGNTIIDHVMTPGYVRATNSFASYSTLATNAVGATGYTNNQVINQTAYVTATAVAFTIKDRSGATLYVSPTLTATLPVNLQPGWAITAASGLVGTVLPW